MPKNSLPEHVVDTNEHGLAKQAKISLDAREKVNEYTAAEKASNGILGTDANDLRLAEAQKDNIIGKITITPPNQGAVRVEFRIGEGSLDVEDLDALDMLFGSARPELFEVAEVVTSITDPAALYEALDKAGLNPWDYLDLKIKKGQDQIVVDKGAGIVTDKAILPKKGFLTNLKPLMKNFSVAAKEYILDYLKGAFCPKVVLGTKVKKK